MFSHVVYDVRTYGVDDDWEMYPGTSRLPQNRVYLPCIR